MSKKMIQETGEPVVTDGAITHTPGPWEWWTSCSWRRLRRSYRGKSQDVLMPFVCSDGQPDIQVSPEDMALIAAAPDMLVAIKMIIDQTMMLQHSPETRLNDIWDIAHAALARAKGRS